MKNTFQSLNSFRRDKICTYSGSLPIFTALIFYYLADNESTLLYLERVLWLQSCNIFLNCFLNITSLSITNWHSFHVTKKSELSGGGQIVPINNNQLIQITKISKCQLSYSYTLALPSHYQLPMVLLNQEQDQIWNILKSMLDSILNSYLLIFSCFTSSKKA